MPEPELAPINEASNQPVTQGEFSSVMGAIKHDLDRIEGQMATKADLAELGHELREELASKAGLAKLQQTTDKLQQTTEMLQRNSERMLDLIEGIDQQLKELRHLPEDVRRLKEAVFH